MSAIGYGAQTMLDIVGTKDVQVNKIINVLAAQDEIVKDLPYFQMNKGDKHEEVILSYAPTPVRRQYNEGVVPDVAKFAKRTYTADKFETTARLDEDLATVGKGVNYNLMKVMLGHATGMANEYGRTIFYGTPEGESEGTDGFATIYSSLTGETASQIVNADDGTGADDNGYTSIYAANWGEGQLFGVYPEGTKAGIETLRRNGGERVKIIGPNRHGVTGEFYGYEETLKQRHGLVAADYRFGGRICNIRVDQLKTGNAADLIDLLIDLQESMRIQKGTAIYVHRVIKSILRKQARNEVKGGGGLTYGNYFGEEVLMFGDSPIRTCDSISLQEGKVS